MNIVELTVIGPGHGPPKASGHRPGMLGGGGYPGELPTCAYTALKMSVASANVAYSTEKFRRMVASDPAFAFMNWSRIFKARQDKTGEG